MHPPIRLLLIGCVCGSVLSSQAVHADNRPAASELKTRDDWFHAHLSEFRLTAGAQPAETPTAALLVLANHDPVLKNTRGERPLTIGKTQYARGLYCHAVSRVVVRLPGPGKRFTAIVGVDSNPQTYGGRGSIVFSVKVRDRSAFKTEVMREGMPAKSVDIDLAGADSFVLEVDDAGDGISCDQADWADAKVRLADGKELWLGDLPLSDQMLAARRSNLPFAFLCGGRSSDDLLATLKPVDAERALSGKHTERTRTWTDPATGLEIRCVAVTYAGHPVVEWTLYLKNIGRQNSPLLESIQGLDMRFAGDSNGEFDLRYYRGDTCSPELYEPQQCLLGPRKSLRFVPNGGRGTNGAFPYYNLAMPGGGVILAVGWPGQWATTFQRDADPGLRIVAGQELTHLRLRPGEVVRSPLIALLFFRGDDRQRAQNLWRRWMIEQNIPRTADGKLPPPILHGNTSGEFHEMCNANEENQKFFIDRYVEEKVPINFWWMDAGWYPCNDWPQTGTWEPDLKRFPHGLRAISDHGRARGIKTLVWFEPERVAGGTYLSENHADWLLGRTLLDLGNPAARRWLTGHVDRVLTEQGIDLYRQDFNMDPLDFWRRNDAPERQGMSENLHIQGYLAYWDALRQRHPGLIIDSCASGGRRNDLETMRRAVPLHPTDYIYGDLPVKQGFHHSLFQWIPYYGSPTVPGDVVTPYIFRSAHALSQTIGYDMRRKDLDYPLMRKLAEERNRIAPYFYGDYYPLLPYSRASDAWLAWQFHRDESGDGLVEAFRRQESGEGAKRLRLSGLDPAAEYEVQDLDHPNPQRIRGKKLMEQGLEIVIADKPGAAVIVYRKLLRLAQHRLRLAVHS